MSRVVLVVDETREEANGKKTIVEEERLSRSKTRRRAKVVEEVVPVARVTTRDGQEGF